MVKIAKADRRLKRHQRDSKRGNMATHVMNADVLEQSHIPIRRQRFQSPTQSVRHSPVFILDLPGVFAPLTFHRSNRTDSSDLLVTGETE